MANLEMQAFVHVVERGSFAGAATLLGLTPSAVSKLVGRLEDRLGVRLLHRTTRRLALTVEGDVYFARSRQILTDIEDAEAEIAKLRGAPRGHLHINTSVGFAAHQLVPALPDFLARYPDINLELSITDQIVDLVTEPADVTIRTGPVADTTFTARKIAEFKRIICASPAYLERRGTPHTVADLARHTCIEFSYPKTKRWPFLTREGVDFVEITPRVVTDSGETALQLALDGVGIARLGDMVANEPIRLKQLVPLLMDVHYAEPVALSALYLAGRHRLPKVRVFLDFLSERFANSSWQRAT